MNEQSRLESMRKHAKNVTTHIILYDIRSEFIYIRYLSLAVVNNKNSIALFYSVLFISVH